MDVAKLMGTITIFTILHMEIVAIVTGPRDCKRVQLININIILKIYSVCMRFSIYEPPFSKYKVNYDDYQICGSSIYGSCELNVDKHKMRAYLPMH